MTQKLITPPTVLAVTLAQAKENLRVDSPDMDALITLWIEGIVSSLEHEIGQRLMSQTWRVTLDEFPDEINLPHPVISITSVTYLDEDDVEQTLAPAAYRLNAKAYATTITPINGTVWPATSLERGAVTIECVCGHGATAADTPKNAQLYILAKLVEQFDPATRTERDTVQSAFVERLLDACRTYQ